MRRLLVFTSGFSLACLLCAFFPGLKPLIWIMPSAGLLFTAGFLLLRKARRILLHAAIGFGVGLLWCTVYGLLFTQPARVLTGKDVLLEGEVISYSTERSGGVRADVRVTDGSVTAAANVFFSRCSQELRPGDRITGTFSLELVHGDTDAEIKLSSTARGIVLNGFGSLETVLRPDRIPFRYLPRQAAHALRESIIRTVPEDAAGFLVALLTSDRSLLSDGAKCDFAASGISHIVAISGTHVSILLAFVILVLGKGKKRTCIIGIPLVIFFVFMTGGTPSVTRAAVMQIIILLAVPLDREVDPPTSISAAALLVLLWDPNSILQLSFLLSFGAVIGILLITGRVNAYLNGLALIRAVLRWRLPGSNRIADYLTNRLHGVIRFVTGTIAATLGALVLTVPIMAIAFGTFSVYAILTNLLVLWVISFCFIGGMLTALIGMICQPVGAILGTILAVPARYVLSVSHWVARLPYAILSMQSAYGIAFLIFIYLVIFAAWFLREERLLIPIGTVLAGLMLTLCFVKLDLHSMDFEVCALDIGEGQCICFLTSDFSAVLDCGGTSGYETGKRAADYLRSRGLDRLNLLILSHYDSDHVNGAESLMQRIPVDCIYLPDVDFDLENRRRIEAAANENEVEIRYVTADTLLEYRCGFVNLYAPVSVANDNAASVSAWIRTGDFDTMVTGDMDTAAEYDLIRTNHLPDVDLYIAGHHGARNASSAELLAVLQPEQVWISVGDNHYGHPMQEALDRFAAIGAVVYRTDLCGDITIGR